MIGLTTFSGSIFGFDASGARWGMNMSFKTAETDWDAVEALAAGIADSAAPSEMDIKWTMFMDLMTAPRGLAPWSLPVGDAELFPSPEPS